MPYSVTSDSARQKLRWLLLDLHLPRLPRFMLFSFVFVQISSKIPFLPLPFSSFSLLNFFFFLFELKTHYLVFKEKESLSSFSRKLWKVLEEYFFSYNFLYPLIALIIFFCLQDSFEGVLFHQLLGYQISPMNCSNSITMKKKCEIIN